MVSPAYHRSVQLLGGVIVIVLVSSPVARVRDEPALGRGNGSGVATKVPLGKTSIKFTGSSFFSTSTKLTQSRI